MLLWPDPAVLLAQAASVGFCLALLALVLRRTIGRRERDALAARGAAPPIIDRSSKRTPYRPADHGKSPTTTASIAVQVAAEDADASDAEVGLGPEQEVGPPGSSFRNP